MRIVCVIVALCCCLAGGDLLNCPPIPHHPPAIDVNHLRPDDIKVVMAMGDSITAGFAMRDKFFLDGWFEYRGDSFSIGGNDNMTTVPNLLMQFVPDLVGYSVGFRDPLDFLAWNDNTSWIPHEPYIDHLNAAQSGACVMHLYQQVAYLISELEQLDQEGTISMQNDWKLLTLFIGANNVCVFCLDDSHSDPEYFAKELNWVITQLYENIPKTFINLMMVLDVSQVYYLSNPDDLCREIQEDLLNECPCVYNNVTRAGMVKQAATYNAIFQQIESDWKQKNLTDFAVIVQPLLEQIKINVNEVSPLDCFHPNQYADHHMAIALWNNMLSPSALKKHTIDPTDEPLCPGLNTFLATN